MLENTTENKTYVSVMDGKFVVKTEKGTRNARERENKNGTKVYELQFDTIGGLLENVQDFKTENQFGIFRNIVFTLRDGAEVYSVSTPYSSRESKGILMRLPNVDLTKPIKLKIGKKEHAFTWVTQFGVTVKPMWNKENQGDLPQMVEIEVKGKRTFDDTDQMKYLFDYIQTHVVDKIPSTSTDQGFNSPALPPADLMHDDLPY